MTVQVFDKKLEDFETKVSVSSCIMRCENKILFIKNANTWRGKWTFPGGKAEADENPEQTLVREVFEEINMNLSEYRFLRRMFYRNPLYGDYEISYFEVIFDKIPEIKLSNEHLESGWFSLEDASKLDLIPGMKESLEMVFHE